MKWIKASERLPPNPGSPQNHWRIDGFHKVEGNFYDFTPGEIVFGVIGHTHDDYNILKKDFDKIEWLDETQQPSPDFVRVEDRLPEHSGKYLTAASDYHKVGHAWYNNKYNPGWEDDKEETIMVTHWMPLPEPPKTTI